MKKLLLCSLIVACCSANANAAAGLVKASAGPNTIGTTSIDYNATTPSVSPVFTSTVKKGSDAQVNDILVTTVFNAPAAGDYCVSASYSGTNSDAQIGVAAASDALGHGDYNCFTGAAKGEQLFLNNFAKGKINAGLTHIILTLTNKAA